MKHIFVNSHDLDTSMIHAQLVNGKGRYTDIPGTCFGYYFEHKQIKRNKLDESIRDQVSDEWLDAHNFVKFGVDDLIASGIQPEEVKLLNALPDDTYVWYTRHVSEMLMNIDKIENAHIVQLVSTGWQKYFQTILNYSVFQRGGEWATVNVDTLAEEIAGYISATDKCATGLVEDGYDIVVCNYHTMFNADAFATKVAGACDVEVDVKRNKKVIADYLEENMGAWNFVSDEEIAQHDWSSKYAEQWDSIISPTLLKELKRSYLSDKRYFTEQGITFKRTVEGYDPENHRDWVDEMVARVEDFLDETFSDDEGFRGNQITQGLLDDDPIQIAQHANNEEEHTTEKNTSAGVAPLDV